MAYRLEENPQTGQSELIIDGFENGIADSPYTGFATIRNLNIDYAKGVAYVNYKRQAATASAMTRPVSYTISPAGIIYFSTDTNQVFKQGSVNGTIFTVIGSNPGTGAGGLQYWNNYILCFRTSQAIDICGDGSGDAGIISSNWNTAATAPTTVNGVWPIADATITTVSSISANDTTASISTYTDAQGSARSAWNGPSGTYLLSLGIGGQQVIGTLTHNSATISWSPAANYTAAATIVVTVLQSGNNNGLHTPIQSRNDGKVYFGNYNLISTIGVNSGYQLSSGSNGTFKKENFASFSYNGVAQAIPVGDQVQGLEELVGNLVIFGNFNIYQWDRVSNFVQNPVPLQEGISKGINILNNLYIFAGNKGNIYISNGYSVSFFKKIPDIATGISPPLVDPIWAIGGLSYRRNKLWFQATAYTNAGTPQFTGIFSLNLETRAITIEAQNSTGTGGSTTDYHGLIIDNSLPALSVNNPGYTTNYDSYYSGSCTLSGGNYTGTMDYNNTTLWSSNEVIIESDIIPVGTFTEPHTFTNMEFKLDQPMRSGDSITAYGRNSLSDSYTQLGTTTSAVLSDIYTPMAIQQMQWLQVKVTMSCNSAAASSSYNRLREIRLR